MTDHGLLVLLAELSILLCAARLGAAVAVRMRAPQVVGELVAGLLLGPTLLGSLWPRGFHAVFPTATSYRSILDAISWIGVMFLVLIAGLATSGQVASRSRRLIVSGWVGGFTLPFVSGLLLGLLAPLKVFGPSATRPVFALFLATAMSISAIPVIASILLDLGLLRSRVGVTIMSTALADDTIGWVLLGFVAGLAGGHGILIGRVVKTAIAVGLLFIVAFTIGPRVVDGILGHAKKLSIPHAQTSAVIAITLVMAMATQAIGIHLVLGTFVAALLMAKAPSMSKDTVQSIREVGLGVFAPIFFAYTGLKVNLTTIHGTMIGFAAIAFAVACFSKIIGGYVGARVGGLAGREALAVGVGQNARGAMELVIATIGLSLGILSPSAYAIVVIIAVGTSLSAAPLLRLCLRDVEEIVLSGEPDPIAGLASAVVPIDRPTTIVLGG